MEGKLLIAGRKNRCVLVAFLKYNGNPSNVFPDSIAAECNGQVCNGMRAHLSLQR